MSQHQYRRTVEELREVAAMFWSAELARQEADISIIPMLLETQAQFIAILSVDVPHIESLFNIIRSSKLPGNLFLKHLVVLADVGGEYLQRVNKQFDQLFPDGQLDYLWGAERRRYRFKTLPVTSLSNARMRIDGKWLFQPQAMNDLYEDVIAILMPGSNAVLEETASVLANCEISNYLGKPNLIDEYVRQRYIWVSRITSGAQSNTLGQLTQKFVEAYLQDHLDIAGIIIKSNGNIPGISQTAVDDERLTTFDLVVSRANRHVAIEISFQVTGNSVIERKQGQAMQRYQQIEQGSNRIAYVIDGAGNLTARESAIRTICNFSHCTVAFTRSELDILCAFIRDYFTES